MRVYFRVDASLSIGSGHVMRCLTLARALREQGARCEFVTRDHVGNLVDLIQEDGYDVYVLPASVSSVRSELSDLAHGAWLGVSQAQDAADTLAVLNAPADWLVIDHYGLDKEWELATRSLASRCFAFDDLADREHAVDVLLDQNLGRIEADYRDLVPSTTRLLMGTTYTLLRPEFPAHRDSSLARRRDPWQVDQMLISLGGVDKDNVTGVILDQLAAHCEINITRIVVIMGRKAPWLNDVRRKAQKLLAPVEVLSGVNNVAEIMASSDLAIGAVGGSAWERCCLGLPTLAVVLAQNQWNGARALQASGGVELLGEPQDLDARLCGAVVRCSQPDVLARMSGRASKLVDGLGLSRVVKVFGEMR